MQDDLYDVDSMPLGEVLSTVGLKIWPQLTDMPDQTGEIHASVYVEIKSDATERLVWACVQDTQKVVLCI